MTITSKDIRLLVLEAVLPEFIKKHLTPDLLKPQYRNQTHKLAGHCYIASEAFYHMLGGRKNGYRPMYVKVKDKSHWFIKAIDGKILDITAEQFSRIPYSKAIAKGFLTKKPSKRSVKLRSKVLKDLKNTILTKVYRV